MLKYKINIQTIEVCYGRNTDRIKEFKKEL